ncbi:hypothetical protein I79_019272 [Cricetulus griseus]|uniref:Uncharacterized protein n=1 Tax=Cricetulus griseus TaxID=10029 RepID=G3I6Z2_CRIGR|nr:hypothetical protein I79_019272 [Cricetulus griseus]
MNAVSHHVGAGNQTQKKQSMRLTAEPSLRLQVFGSSLPTLDSRVCEKAFPTYEALGQPCSSRVPPWVWKAPAG